MFSSRTACCTRAGILPPNNPYRSPWFKSSESWLRLSLCDTDPIYHQQQNVIKRTVSWFYSSSNDTMMYQYNNSMSQESINQLVKLINWRKKNIYEETDRVGRAELIGSGRQRSGGAEGSASRDDAAAARRVARSLTRRPGRLWKIVDSVVE